MRRTHKSKMDLKNLKDGRKYSCDSGSTMTRPEWLDVEQFRRGQLFFQKHLVCCLLCLFFSLASGLAVPNLLHVLQKTGQTDTPQNSLKRYFKTFCYVMRWHYGNFWIDDEESSTLKSVLAIRDIHRNVAKKLNSCEVACESCEEVEKTHVISQYDMALVQCGFMGIIIMYPDKFGIKCSVEELEDYIHFWSCIGFLLGMEDKYNICSGNYLHTNDICKQIEQEVLLPNFKKPHAGFHEMSEAFINGFNLVFHCTALSKEAVFARGLEVTGEARPTMGLKDTLRYWTLRLFVGVLWYCPRVKQFLNRRIYEQTHKIWKNMKIA